MALQNKLKAFVRFDGSGRVIPSSLILQKSKPKVGNWKEINATQCCNSVPGTTTTTTTVAGTVVKISHDQMFDPVCTTQTTLSVTVTDGTSFSDAVTITGDFASLGVYYTPADPGNPMSQPPRFRIAYISEGVLKNREFTLIAVGVASGIGNMGPTQEQVCPTPTTTTTTTAAPLTTYRIGITPYGSDSESCSNVGDLNGGTTLYAHSTEWVNGVQLYYDEYNNFPYTGTGWYPAMVGWPSGFARAMYIQNGVIQSSSPC